MKTRTILTLALTLTFAAACNERAEREDGPDDEAAEMREGDASRAGMIELPAELLARAHVTVEAALASALGRVPGGHVSAGELEEEDGKLIYSFDLRVDGRDGIEEVHVDALTGDVVAQEHESAAMEADEEGRR